MKVPKTIINNWKIYAEHGDATEISDSSEFSRQTISKALNAAAGTMSEDVFKVIDTFYTKRKENLKQIANQVAKK